MSLSRRPFKTFVEEELGAFPHFLLWAILEWILIASLYMDGFLAFFSSTFAKIFDLEPPCVLCTRVDHALVAKDPNTFYNDSICECHKKDISCLAYCHVHRKLANIQFMCEGCVLASATDKESRNKLLLRSMQKEKDEFSEDDKKVSKHDNMCSCCGEPLKLRALSNLRASAILATSPPRTCFTPTAYTELRFVSDTEPDMQECDFGLSTYAKNYEEMNEECCRTPYLLKCNKFFGIPLTDSAVVTSGWANKTPRKVLVEKSEETIDESGHDSSLQQIKKQAFVDQKNLIMTLSRELDEERSAAAVAANNAMAMITRLQGEKAGVQMEALQYQRMMEEQAEYDKEAIHILKDLLANRDEHLKVMESELDSYREKYGEIRKVGSDQCEADADEYYQEWKSHSLSSFSEKSESRRSLLQDNEHEFQSPLQKDDDDDDESWTPLGTDEKDGEIHFERDTSLLDFETQKDQLYGMLKNLENHIQSPSMEDEWDDEEDKDTFQENRATLKREVSLIRERLRVLEANSGFLKHTAMTLQKGEKGTELLTEIAQHLRKLRDHSQDLNRTDA